MSNSQIPKQRTGRLLVSASAAAFTFAGLGVYRGVFGNSHVLVGCAVGAVLALAGATVGKLLVKARA